MEKQSQQKTHGCVRRVHGMVMKVGTVTVTRMRGTFFLASEFCW